MLHFIVYLKLFYYFKPSLQNVVAQLFLKEKIEMFTYLLNTKNDCNSRVSRSHLTILVI